MINLNHISIILNIDNGFCHNIDIQSEKTEETLIQKRRLGKHHPRTPFEYTLDYHLGNLLTFPRLPWTTPATPGHP